MGCIGKVTHIEQVTDTIGSNRTPAAKILRIALGTLQRKLKAFGDSPTAPK
jgi:DNA-binding protein Fis